MTTPARVDDDGIRLPGTTPGDQPVDVRLGEHRVWSFTPARDGRPDGDGVLVTWPAALAAELRGTTEVSVVPHAGGDPLYAGPVRFGGSDEPLVLVDDAGNPLSLDKGNRLQRTFDRMDDEARHELAVAARKVLDDLVEHCGLDAYLAYGCLLGAVRDGGRMIGHDSDADLAWLSRHTHVLDVIRESRAAERTLRERGWRLVRMSAANFKVWVPMPNGKRAGIDVFGSFHVGERFHLTASLRGDLAREAIVPFGEVELEGVRFPAPRDVEAFLAFTYGPGWRTPDPAFHFEHPADDVRLLDHWLRGTRTRLPYWQGFYTSRAHQKVPAEESAFVHWFFARVDPETRVVDLGAGTGRDTYWLADRGFRVTAADFAPQAVQDLTQASQARTEHAFVVRQINFESPYNALVRGAQLAHRGAPTHVYARGIVDALAPSARPHLWRFCTLAGRAGGHTFLEFRTPASAGEPTAFGPHPRTYADPEQVVAEITARGGRVLDRQQGRGLAVLGEEDPEVYRLQVEWTLPRSTGTVSPRTRNQEHP